MPHTKAAFDQLERLLPSFKRHVEPKSLLYVGWRHDCNRWWYDTMCPALGIERVGVLEVFKPNIEDLENRIWCDEYDLDIHAGDITKLADTDIWFGDYDVVFWDHGPEHVSKEKLASLTPVLNMFAKRMVIYCCPMGDWPQGADGGNEWERHLWAPMPSDFLELGMTVTSTGTPGTEGDGELIAFSFSEEYQIPTGGS